MAISSCFQTVGLHQEQVHRANEVEKKVQQSKQKTFTQYIEHLGADSS
jgi:hypothetical protein